MGKRGGGRCALHVHTCGWIHSCAGLPPQPPNPGAAAGRTTESLIQSLSYMKLSSVTCDRLAHALVSQGHQS